MTNENASVILQDFVPEILSPPTSQLNKKINLIIIIIIIIIIITIIIIFIEETFSQTWFSERTSGIKIKTNQCKKTKNMKFIKHLN